MSSSLKEKNLKESNWLKEIKTLQFLIPNVIISKLRQYVQIVLNFFYILQFINDTKIINFVRAFNSQGIWILLYQL